MNAPPRWAITPNDLKFFATLDARQAESSKARRCGNCKHFALRHPLATTAACPVVASIVAPNQQIQCHGFAPRHQESKFAP